MPIPARREHGAAFSWKLYNTNNFAMQSALTSDRGAMSSSGSLAPDAIAFRSSCRQGREELLNARDPPDFAGSGSRLCRGKNTKICDEHVLSAEFHVNGFVKTTGVKDGGRVIGSVRDEIADRAGAAVNPRNFVTD